MVADGFGYSMSHGPLIDGGIFRYNIYYSALYLTYANTAAYQTSLPREAKPFCFILYADKTRLSSFGTEKGYPVVARCANLPVHIRNSNGVGGGEVVGWLPIVKFLLPLTLT